MLKKKNILILSLGFSLGVFIATSATVLAERDKVIAPEKPTNGSLPYAELREFTEVFGRIKRDYVETVEDKKLLEDAIKGMLSGLDPHSSYLDKDGYKELMEGTKGQFGGLGIEVTMENGFVRVVSPIDDTPAQRAGIQAGDLIVKLDKNPVKGMTLGDAVKIMRGKPGDEIILTVIRKGSAEPLIIPVKRAIIRVKSVKSRLLEKGYGYVRISSFQSKTYSNLQESIKGLIEENKGNLKGMVLDLRNNPGGLLRSAVGVSDTFLEKGLIVYTEGRIKNSKISFDAEAGDAISGAPLVVLINAGSASASEIVSGALQDHKRAVIMGEKSFGKGSVQTILPTSNGAAIKLTTARYFTPLGRSIQAEGIKPDVVLEKFKLESVKPSNYKPIKEADLSRHLENAEEFSAKELGNKKEKDEDKKKAKNKKLDDYALHEALNLLKAISILK
jgi:carboxyl-terminal processing protease